MPLSNKEIMRGSIVLFEGKVRQVKAVSELIMLEGTNAWIGAGLMSEEPISAEWLNKFEFDLVQEGDMAHPDIYRKLYKRVLVTNQFDIQSRGINEFYWIEGNTIVPIYSVHELQRLYLSLTGEHLKIPKLPK